MAGFTASSQPSRPYSAPDQLGGATPRTGEFNTGIAGDPDSAATATARASTGLTDSSLQFRALVPHGVKPASVLQPLMRNPGGNGMSAGDAARRTVDGTYLGSVNGTSANSFEPAAMLRLSGGLGSE